MTSEGLLILREDAKVGQPFAEYLGRTGSDVVYDLEITPNRPDLNSVIGIAREISAVTGNPLRLPADQSSARGEASARLADLVAVRIEDAELCPRYTARVIRGVKIAPSPDWLQEHAGEGRRSQHQQRGGCDQLRHARNRASPCTPSIIICWPRRRRRRSSPHHRRPPRRRRREIHDARRPGAHAHQPDAADCRRNQGRRPGRRHGRPEQRDQPQHGGCADRKRLFQAAEHPRHLQEARAAHRILLSLRARRRRRHLRLGQPARRAVDPARPPAARSRQGVVDAYPKPVEPKQITLAPPARSTPARHRSAPRSSRSRLSAASSASKVVGRKPSPCRRRVRAPRRRPASACRPSAWTSNARWTSSKKSPGSTAWTRSPPRPRAAPSARTPTMPSTTNWPTLAAS